jgi:hypothetical protein
MFLKSSREGYLMIDHRASPGLPDGFMRSLGLEGFEAPEGKVIDGATLTCAHCGVVQVKNPGRTRERGQCFKCDDYICDGCSLKMKLGHPCKPHVKTLDDAEKRAYREQQNSLVSRFNLIKG